MALTAGIRKLFARPARPPAALLIGTPDSLPALRRLLAGGAPQVRAIGCLLDAPAPRRCAGLPVLGTLEDAEQIAQDKQLRHIYISLPAPRGQQQSRLALRLQQQGLDVCCVPTPTDLLGGGATLPARRLDLARLLDRSPRPIDRAAVSRTLQGKRILITGAGGSIGAELARIAAEFDPACLLLMDRSENGLFEIDRELAARHGQLRRRAIL
ncbi:MAG: polysaccharide biosynthesis protein, partial [Phycisphaerae bacterium]|nr:polysaccharide biosynthesis protein [Phycisphaerae bacterium]